MFAFILSALDSHERDILSRLYEQNYRRLLKTAFRIVQSTEASEDAVAETFLEAIKDENKIFLRSPVNFAKWSVIVVRNKCYDFLRRNKNRVGFVLPGYGEANDYDAMPDVAADDPPLDWNLIRKDNQAILEKALAEIEPLSRQILEMKYVGELSCEQICSHLNMTSAGVNGRLARTRAKLKTLLKKGDMV